MPRSPGSHWQGPQLCDDRAAGGLFEHCPIGAMNQRVGWVFHDDFLEAAAARVGAAGTHWTLTQLAVGGTLVAVGTPSEIQLSHGTANQGPSIRLAGTHFTALAFTGLDPGTNDRMTVAAMEATVIRNNAATATDFYLGFMTDVAAHPLLVTGIPNVAGVADMAGFTWAASAVGSLSQADAGVLRTLAGAPAVPLLAQSTRTRYGVRIETTNSPVDRVYWYVNGRLLFSALVAAGQFSGSMTVGFGMVNESGAGATWNVGYCTVGTWERAE